MLSSCKWVDNLSKIPWRQTQNSTTHSVHTRTPWPNSECGPFKGKAVFTFIDFIALTVHLSFQDVALNQTLHNFLWRREQKETIKNKEGAILSGAQILSIDLQPFCSSWQSSSKRTVRGATIAVPRQTSHQEAPQSVWVNKGIGSCDRAEGKKKKNYGTITPAEQWGN